MGVTVETELVRLLASFMMLAHTIAEPLEEEVEASSTLVAQAKSRRSISTIGTVADVVLEQSLTAIVANFHQSRSLLKEVLFTLT
jgi:hypothetical protein